MQISPWEPLLFQDRLGKCPPTLGPEGATHIHAASCGELNPVEIKRYLKTKDANLVDRPRSGRPEKVSGEVKAYIIATACTDAPEGRSRWTVRLLADHIIQLELLDSVSKDTIARILKKTNLNLGEG